MTTLDQDTKNQVKALFQDWVSGRDQRKEINNQLNETIEATSQLLQMEKKNVRKLYRVMDTKRFSDEYSIVSLAEEVEND